VTGTHLVVVDMQRVFADAGSPWATPDFAAILPTVADLAKRFADAATFTRFIAPDRPAGAWRDYYAEWPFALQPPDAPLWDVVPELAPAAHTAPTVDATTFSKWGPALADRVGDATMVLCGVSTDCCVLSTAVAAADAGVPVRVVADACAGVSAESHRATLDVLALYGPLVRVVSSADLS
jgi:nicotinamidase-related amidase